ncbi:DUF3999 domain-containing protein [Pedobacter petrophilus]|uniref:DUF3999 domain-containing protein n=1 Tax=Pedobacter petrophilus TaxID=1908241 RepID=A0A7K0FVM4_9SPHI|nr:DUF3999 domain-containing protein [Pedobacter petrophilus]MRX75280.1 DUF3999 domain-containing protein [Pedobacter petrophilus]
MMFKKKIKLLLPLLFCIAIANAQTNIYKFKRQISGVNTIWHSISLPDELYKNANAGFEDLRIFGVSGKDTVEVPYLLKQRADQINTKEVSFKQINQSTNENGFYYTFQAPAGSTINQINLSFKQTNFDWQVTLAGSNDNKEWFGILKNYRILSIQNTDTDYKFTKLKFPDAKYQYFRIAIKCNVHPHLIAAKLNKTDTVGGVYKQANSLNYHLSNDAVQKQTVIEVNLKNPVPLSYLKLKAQSDFDFYRSFKIEAATDSFKSEKGMQYNYTGIYDGTISSLEETAFSFPNTITSKLRITIQNNDNKPLRISNLELKGNAYEIIARFEDLKANYAIYYGNEKSTAPSYEIEKFEKKIPTNLTTVSVGNEEKNPAYTIKTEKPLFENKIWLWVLMTIIIVLLGWFSFKMLKN